MANTKQWRKKFKSIGIVLIFCCIDSIYAQKMQMSVVIDTGSCEITTHVSFIAIPDGGRIRFQQRLSAQTKLIQLPLNTLPWDTSNNIFSMICVQYPSVDTLNFSFVCKADTLPDILQWGEATLMYEDKNRQICKIELSAENYIVRQNEDTLNSVPKVMFYYIQVFASAKSQRTTDIAKRVHLQTNDAITEHKTEKYYKYLVGQFSSKEQAEEKLEYYRQYIPDAFIVRY
jgi:hypothetical protein